MFQQVLRYLCFALIVSLGLTACSGNLTDTEHVAKAEAYFKKGDIKSATIEAKNAIAKNQKNAQAHRILGILYLVQGDFLAAEKELRRAVNLGMEKNDVLVPLAQSLLAQKKYPEVLIEIGLPEELPPQHRAELTAYRGDAWLAQGETEKAEKEYKLALSLDPKAPAAILGLAKLAVTQKDLPRARQLIEEALQIAPNDRRLWRLKGQIAQSQKHLEDAEKAFTKAIELSPAPRLLDVASRAIIRLDLKKLDAAEQDIQLLKKIAPKHPFTHYAAGRLALEHQQHAQAQTELEQAIKYNTDFHPAYLPLGIAHLAQGHLTQAEKALQHYVSHYPDNLAAKRALALARYRLQDYTAAKETLLSILADFPADAYALTLLSQIESQQGNIKQAKAYLKKLMEVNPEAVRIALPEGSNLPAGNKEQLLEAALRLNPDFFPAQVQLAMLYLRNNQLDKAEKIVQQLSQKAPDSAATLSVKGILLAKRGKTKEAEKILETALAKAPDNPNAAFALADLYLRQHNYNRARELYNHVAKLYPRNPEIPFRLALVDVKEGKQQEAIKRLEILRQDHPTAEKPGLLLARLYQHTGQLEKARSLLEQLTNANSKATSVLAELVNIYLSTKQPEKALDTANQVATLAPNSPDSHYLLAHVYASLNDPAKTEQALKKALSLNAKHLPALIALARFYVVNKQPQQAKQIFDTLQQYYPDSPDLLAEISQLSIRLNDTQRAIDAYVKAIELSPRPEWIVDLAKLYWRSGNQKQALDLITKWQLKLPNDPLLSYSLALLQQKAGQQGQAIALLEHTLKLKPDHTEALNNLAWLLKDKAPERALEYARQAAELAPHSPAVLDTLAMILLQQGKDAEALRVMEPVSQQLSHPQIQLHWAKILAANNQKQKAAAVLSKILENPKASSVHEDAKALLQQLQS